MEIIKKIKRKRKKLKMALLLEKMISEKNQKKKEKFVIHSEI
jgi:hypothetical protein